MITMHKILELYGISPGKTRLVRHGNKELPILKTFHTNHGRFEAYQSFQVPKKFGKAKYIAVFAPARGTTAVFLGLWNINGYRENSKLTKGLHAIIDKHDFPKGWHEKAAWYDLERNSVTDDLSERLIIDWGGATVSWVQSRDKPVLEIKGEHSLGEFVSYDDVQINYREIQKLAKETSSNTTWVTALSSVNGIYLIIDKSTGKLYVGSAYGEQGIYGRWISYASTGHGGNAELKKLDPAYFEFSILEIVPSTASAEDVIRRENKWKERLGTRVFGLNLN